MDIFDFTGKVLFEDLPTLFFDKIPETFENGLDKISDTIDKILE